MGQFGKFIALALGGFGRNTCQSSCQKFEITVRKLAMRHPFKEFLECYSLGRAFIFTGSRYSLFRFSHTNGIYQKEAVLAKCVRRYVSQYIITDGACASSFHLDIQWFGADITHENQDFKRLDIRAGGDKRTSHGNAELLVVSERTDKSIAVA